MRNINELELAELIAAIRTAEAFGLSYFHLASHMLDLNVQAAINVV